MSVREKQSIGRPRPGTVARNTTASHKEPAHAPRLALRAAPADRKNTEFELTSDVDTTEKFCQFTLSMRESLHRELAMAALADGMTMRGLIMRALRDLGLDVRDDDLIDRRRK